MRLDNLQISFSKEEVETIRKRVAPGLKSSTETDEAFFLFFEEIRKKAELYALVMFNGFKVMGFSEDHDHAVIHDKAGKEFEVELI